MVTNTSIVAVARGAVLPEVRPWADPLGPGVNHALGRQFHVPALGMPSTRFVVSRRVPAMAQPAAGMAAALPIDIRTQNVHKTRVNAGGDGASGPHPEREPA